MTQLKLYAKFYKETKSPQLVRLLKTLGNSRQGLTTMQLIDKAKTTCPHKRMSELRNYGFDITKAERRNNGLNYYRWRV